jgi:ribosomal protein S18 acetylase RimI-like enzyme
VAEQFVVEPLGVQHQRATFSCGEPALDQYLQQRAGQEQRRKVAAVFMFRETTTNAIVGFYTLSMFAVTPSELPDDFARKLPRYERLPAALIGRLAVDSRFGGRGLGSYLLVNALERCLIASDQIAAVAVVVDAKNDRARVWYAGFGFIQFMDDPNRLFLPMGSIKKLVEGAIRP